MSDFIKDMFIEVREKPKEKNSIINAKTMMEMIENIMNSDLTLISEEKEPSMEDLYKYLPQFEFSEMIGRPDDADIANKAEVSSTFTAMMRNIAPNEGLPAKIAAINEFVSAANPEDKDASEILRNLTFLRLLSVVVQDFTDAGAGFIFEAFLAGLLGGAQVSGRGGEETKGSLPIHDYVDDKGVPVSLKLLNPKTSIEGSMYNITKFLANHPLGIEHGIRYIVAIKYDDEKLGFYEFTITRDNFFEWLGSKVKLDRLIVPQLSQPIQEASEPTDEQLEKLKQHADNFKKLLISLMPMLGYPVKGAQARLNKLEDAAQLTSNAGMGALYHLWDKELMVSKKGHAAFNKFLEITNTTPPPNTQIGPESDLLAVRKARYALLQLKIIRLSEDNPLSIRPFRKAFRLGQRMSGKDSTTVPDKIARLKDLAATNPQLWGKTILAASFTHPQFHLDQAQALSDPETTDYGNLVVGKTQVLKVMNSYGTKLRERILPIYRQLYEVTAEINKFFVQGEMGAANKAADAGADLADSTETLAAATETYK